MNDTTQDAAFERIMKDAIAISKDGDYQAAIELLHTLVRTPMTSDQEAAAFHLMGLFWRLKGDMIEANLWFREAMDVVSNTTELQAEIALSIARNNIDRALVHPYGSERKRLMDEADKYIELSRFSLPIDDDEMVKVAFYYRIAKRFGRRWLVTLIMIVTGN